MFDQMTLEQMNIPRKYWSVELDEIYFEDHALQVEKVKHYIDNFEDFRYKHGLVLCSEDQPVSIAISIGAMYRFWESDNFGNFPVYFNYLDLPKILEEHKKNPDKDDLWNRITRAEFLVIGNFRNIECQFESEEKFLIQTISNLIVLRGEDARPTFLTTPIPMHDDDLLEDYRMIQKFKQDIKYYMKFLILE